MPKSDLIPDPVSRKLRIFAFDPSLSAQFDTAGIGEITIGIPWEKDLKLGPVGEYVEVIDADPASGAFQTDTDLDKMPIPEGAPKADWKRFQARATGDRWYFGYTVTR